MPIPRKPITIVTFALALVALGPPLTADASSWYVEAAGGQGSLDARFGSNHPKWFDDESETLSVAGGYELHRFVAVEVGYHDLGQYQGFGSPCPQGADACIERLATLALCAEGSGCTEVFLPLQADVDGVSFSAVPRWPLGERFTLLGKVGILAWESDLEGPGGFGRIEQLSDEALLLGLGLRVELGRGLGLTAAYQDLDLDLTTASLGLSWSP